MSSEHLKKAKKQAGIISDYQGIFNSPQGRNVLKDMMRAHGFLGSSFSTNVLEMAQKEGERNVVLRILHNLNTNVNDVLKYIDEMQRGD
jgi:hypothetical protein